MTATDCVVVNYNAGRRLADCVRDLLLQKPPVSVTVVDNRSTDGSLERLKGLAADGGRLRVLRNDANVGYAAACNRGAGQGDAEFLAFVNPDCRLSPSVLDRMRRTLAADEGAALAGALVVDPDGGVQRGTRRRLPTPWRALMTFTGLERFARRWPGLRGVHEAGASPREPIRVEAVNGACLLMRRSAFEALGGFDERYFLHCEDLDLFRRLREAGWGVLLAPVRITHYRGTSSRTAPGWVHWHKHASMLRYLLRHHAHARDWLWLPLACAGIVLRLVLLWPAAWLAGRRKR